MPNISPIDHSKVDTEQSKPLSREELKITFTSLARELDRAQNAVYDTGGYGTVLDAVRRFNAFCTTVGIDELSIPSNPDTLLWNAHITLQERINTGRTQLIEVIRDHEIMPQSRSRKTS
jgi:hypothetical protein